MSNPPFLNYGESNAGGFTGEMMMRNDGYMAIDLLLSLPQTAGHNLTINAVYKMIECDGQLRLRK